MSEQVRVETAFQELCPALTDEEYAGLEKSILEEGCRESLIVWKEGGTPPPVLDGHHRLGICNTHKLNYAVRQKSFKTREEAVNWIINNQLSRRNLTPQQAGYLRGKRYELEIADVDERRSKTWMANRSAKHSSGKNNQNPRKPFTGERLAEEYGVSDSTVRKDAKFAAAVDKLAAAHGPEVKKEILSGKTKLTKGQVVKVAALPPSKSAKVLAEGPKALGPRKPKKKVRFDYLEAAESIETQFNSLISRVVAAADGQGSKFVREAHEQAVTFLKSARHSVRQAITSLRRAQDVLEVNRTAQNGSGHKGAGTAVSGNGRSA